MDKANKLNYQREVEKYLEGKKVYEVFEELLQAVLINKPEDPVDFMIQKLNEPEQRKIFIVGPPGSHVRELALQLADYLGYTCSSVGDLLNKEISKKTDLGKTIEECFHKLNYVPDEIVIDLVKRHLSALDKDKKSFVLEGFPKTRTQGLSLQREGIIPDTFLLLNLPDDEIVNCVQKKVGNSDGRWAHLKDNKNVPKDYATEYKLNISQVKEIYGHYFFQIDAHGSEENLLEEMARLVKYRIKSKSPKRSARIIVMGPPGSGRSSLATKLSQRYGFVHVSTAQLLADQAANKTDIGLACIPLIAQGDSVPDDIIGALVANRIKQPDCQIHGYLLDGFPKTIEQIQLLEEMKIQPTVIVILECPDEITEERLENKRIDPHTGIEYDITHMDPDLPEDVIRRLVTRPQDQKPALTNRLNRWKELLKVIEQHYSPYILKVSATLSEKNVLEKIGFYLENS